MVRNRLGPSAVPSQRTRADSLLPPVRFIQRTHPYLPHPGLRTQVHRQHSDGTAPREVHRSVCRLQPLTSGLVEPPLRTSPSLRPFPQRNRSRPGILIYGQYPSQVPATPTSPSSAFSFSLSLSTLLVARLAILTRLLLNLPLALPSQ